MQRNMKMQSVYSDDGSAKQTIHSALLQMVGCTWWPQSVCWDVKPCSIQSDGFANSSGAKWVL